MLWAYFDESGTHNPLTGNVDWLVIGGAIAPEENWRKAALEWSRVLADFDIPQPFHMNDFAHSKSPFNKLDDDANKALLGRLLDVKDAYIDNVIGITNSKKPSQTEYIKIHTKCLKDILKVVTDRTVYRDEEVSVVFAEHPDVNLITIKTNFEDVRANSPAFASCGVDTPANSPELQMADLFAYELHCSMREGYPTRHPLSTLSRG